MNDHPVTADDSPDVGNGVEIARITIIKTFNDDVEGGTAVHVSYTEDLSIIDALGMLAFAQAVTMPTYPEDNHE